MICLLFAAPQTFILLKICRKTGLPVTVTEWLTVQSRNRFAYEQLTYIHQLFPVNQEKILNESNNLLTFLLNEFSTLCPTGTTIKRDLGWGAQFHTNHCMKSVYKHNNTMCVISTWKASKAMDFLPSLFRLKSQFNPCDRICFLSFINYAYKHSWITQHNQLEETVLQFNFTWSEVVKNTTLPTSSVFNLTYLMILIQARQRKQENKI